MMFGGPMQMVQPNGTPQRCALVQNNDNTVINVIVADPSVDQAPAGFILVGLPDDSPVSFGWIYNPADGSFTDPNPPAVGA